MPIGLMIYAKPFQEDLALRVAYAYEQATNCTSGHPDLSWVDCDFGQVPTYVSNDGSVNNFDLTPFIAALAGEDEPAFLAQFPDSRECSFFQVRNESLDRLSGVLLNQPLNLIDRQEFERTIKE